MQDNFLDELAPPAGWDGHPLDDGFRQTPVQGVAGGYPLSERRAICARSRSYAPSHGVLRVPLAVICAMVRGPVTGLLYDLWRSQPSAFVRDKRAAITSRPDERRGHGQRPRVGNHGRRGGGSGGREGGRDTTPAGACTEPAARRDDAKTCPFVQARPQRSCVAPAWDDGETPADATAGCHSAAGAEHDDRSRPAIRHQLRWSPFGALGRPHGRVPRDLDGKTTIWCFPTYWAGFYSGATCCTEASSPF